jgi:hypothetical protein
LPSPSTGCCGCGQQCIWTHGQLRQNTAKTMYHRHQIATGRDRTRGLFRQRLVTLRKLDCLTETCCDCCYSPRAIPLTFEVRSVLRYVRQCQPFIHTVLPAVQCYLLSCLVHICP